MKIDRVLAPNPGIFTGPGTNTWLLEDQDQVVIIDPGPRLAAHERAIVDAVRDRNVAAILVTHTHEDHAPLANPLAREFGVAAYGHGRGPEFVPDDVLIDGSVLDVGASRIEVVHTPGHSDDHLCFLAGRVLFTGDHIMGGSSVMVEEMGAYLTSLQKVRDLDPHVLYPGHGEVMVDPGSVIDWYVAHRMERERQVLDAVSAGAATVEEVVAVVYQEVDPALHILAAVSVSAHLGKLADDGKVRWDGSKVRPEPVP